MRGSGRGTGRAGRVEALKERRSRHRDAIETRERERAREKNRYSIAALAVPLRVAIFARSKFRPANNRNYREIASTSGRSTRSFYTVATIRL
jgi:hypothetical protein